jgi:hypothetical protein
MRVSDDSLEQPKPKNPRLYNGVISYLELIKILGLIGSVFWGIAAGEYSTAIGFITFITSAFTIYISMTSCIAIIDLLSRIEHNTRRPQFED